MISERIKNIREENNMTQNDLAKKLNITRSSVNAWEMGISIPSTQYIVEIAMLFKVSADYLLGLTDNNRIDISELSKEERMIILNLLKIFNKNIH